VGRGCEDGMDLYLEKVSVKKVSDKQVSQPFFPPISTKLIH